MSYDSTEREQLSATDSQSSMATSEGFPSARQFRWIVVTLLVYFGLRLLYFAITISPNVPPDEVTHFGVSRIFSRVLFLPVNSPETYQYGLVTNIPWLYYWIMGKLLVLNFFGISDLLYLRLLNIPLAFGTVYFVWRVLRLLTDDRLTQLLLIVAMTNTLMFSFLSASVSYDNLTNLLAAMAVYSLLAFFKDRSGNLLAASILCQLAGCLTKSSFLPLVLVMNILLLIHEFKDLPALPSALKGWFQASVKRGLGLTLAILVGLALNIQLYGGNYLHYRNLAPEMGEVLPPEIAMQNRIYARNTIFIAFKERRVSFEKAMEMASQISHPGDRAAAVYMIDNYAGRRSSEEQLMGPVAYIVPWGLRMLASTFGILGHVSMINEGPAILPFIALMVLTCLGILIRWRPREAAGLPTYLAVIAAFYGIFLLYAINYKTYLYYELFNLALQGRYIFPVIGPLYVLSCYYLLHLFRGRYLRLGVFLAAAVIFIGSEFPYFLINATPDWFALPLK